MGRFKAAKYGLVTKFFDHLSIFLNFRPYYVLDLLAFDSALEGLLSLNRLEQLRVLWRDSISIIFDLRVVSC